MSKTLIVVTGRNYKFEAGASEIPDWVRRYFTTESD